MNFELVGILVSVFGAIASIGIALWIWWHDKRVAQKQKSYADHNENVRVMGLMFLWFRTRIEYACANEYACNLEEAIIRKYSNPSITRLEMLRSPERFHAKADIKEYAALLIYGQLQGAGQTIDLAYQLACEQGARRLMNMLSLAQQEEIINSDIESYDLLRNRFPSVCWNCGNALEGLDVMGNQEIMCASCFPAPEVGEEPPTKASRHYRGVKRQPRT